MQDVLTWLNGFQCFKARSIFDRKLQYEQITKLCLEFLQLSGNTELERTSVLLQSEDKRSGKRRVAEGLSMEKPSKNCLACTFFFLVIIYGLGASFKLSIYCRGATNLAEQRVESILTSESCKKLSHQFFYVFLRCKNN